MPKSSIACVTLKTLIICATLCLIMLDSFGNGNLMGMVNNVLMMVIGIDKIAYPGH